MTSKTQITRCPYCKSDFGYYIEEACRGIYQRSFNFRNENTESQYLDTMQYGKSKVARCSNCEKSLGRWIKNE